MSALRGRAISRKPREVENPRFLPLMLKDKTAFYFLIKVAHPFETGIVLA